MSIFRLIDCFKSRFAFKLPVQYVGDKRTYYFYCFSRSRELITWIFILDKTENPLVAFQ